MEQHPVPQNITSYEFRLVGDMTLKQFFQLAGGILVGIIIYRLPLFGLIKYPLVLISVVLGVVMAFVPINGRPFTQWIKAFFHAIYSPTEFVWLPAPEEAPVSPQAAAVAPAAPSISLNFSSFFQKKTTPLPTPPSPITHNPSPITAPPPSPTTPNPSPITSVPTPAPVKTLPVPPPPPTSTTFSKVTAPPPPPPSQISTSISNPITANIPLTPTPISIPTPPPPTTPNPLPITPTPSPITHNPQPIPLAPQATPTATIQSPTVPNILSGLIQSSSGTPVDSATVEIIDSSTGIPARALRTNRLGQFQIAIPLPVGNYVINSEKDGLFFDPVSVKVANQIIDPIIMKARP